MKCSYCAEFKESRILVQMVSELTGKNDTAITRWYHGRQHKLFVFKQTDPWTGK